MAGEKSSSNKLQWWIMVSLFSIVTLGGAAWASNVDNRIRDIEIFQRDKLPQIIKEALEVYDKRLIAIENFEHVQLPKILKALVDDHEKNIHKGAVSLELFKAHTSNVDRQIDLFSTRLERMDNKLDQLLQKD